MNIHAAELIKQISAISSTALTSEINQHEPAALAALMGEAIAKKQMEYDEDKKALISRLKNGMSLSSMPKMSAETNQHEPAALAALMREAIAKKMVTNPSHRTSIQTIKPLEGMNHQSESLERMMCESIAKKQTEYDEAKKALVAGMKKDTSLVGMLKISMDQNLYALKLSVDSTLLTKLLNAIKTVTQ